jgi:fumarate hydratase subunit beta
MIITTPFDISSARKLKAGDNIYISGTIYTGRDAAHKRLYETITKGEELPFDLKNQIIYYVGPCPSKPGQIINSCGPTTSSRMDLYAPLLIEKGLTGMIGKGLRDENVINAMRKYGAVYFGAIGGAAALIADTIKSQEIIAYDDLGTEAIRKLYVEKFPVTVIIDSFGNNLYEIGRKKYEKR